MEKPAVKRGAWSYEEDRKLTTYVKKYGIWNWNQMPKYAGLSRSGKSCRLRWMNYLRPDVKLGKFTEEEDETIIKMHEDLGNRWSVIARKLPGRTDNEIKNHWHTRLKKRLLSKKNAVNPINKAKAAGEKTIACEEESIEKNSEGSNHITAIADEDDGVGNTEVLLHTSMSSGSMVDDSDNDLIFWTQPFLIETSSMEEDHQQFGYGHSQFDDGFDDPLETSTFVNDLCLDFLFSFSETEDILSCI